jgi:hypothetical protein
VILKRGLLCRNHLAVKSNNIAHKSISPWQFNLLWVFPTSRSVVYRLWKQTFSILVLPQLLQVPHCFRSLILNAPKSFNHETLCVTNDDLNSACCYSAAAAHGVCGHFVLQC